MTPDFDPKIHVRVKVGKRFTLLDRNDLPLMEGRRWSTRQRGGTFYVQSFRPDRIPLHSLILDKAGLEIDHINRDGLDNRRCNLRRANRSEQCQNRFTPISRF